MLARVGVGRCRSHAVVARPASARLTRSRMPSPSPSSQKRGNRSDRSFPKQKHTHSQPARAQLTDLTPLSRRHTSLALALTLARSPNRVLLLRLARSFHFLRRYQRFMSGNNNDDDNNNAQSAVSCALLLIPSLSHLSSSSTTTSSSSARIAIRSIKTRISAGSREARNTVLEVQLFDNRSLAN